MNRKHRSAISTFSAQITSTISVALVLLLVGIVAFMAIAAKSATTSIRENMGFDVVLKEDTGEHEINRMKQQWTSSNYVSSIKFFSADDAMRKWEEDTGEDLLELCGVNPFSPEFEIRVKEEYASNDSIYKITLPLRNNPVVAEVNIHSQMVETINRNISSIAFILMMIAAVLMLISFVLINNTVRLTIYSRRFIIHTMKLVGATASFIRRPFIVNNVVHGIAASIIAMLILSAALYYLHTVDTAITNALNIKAILFVYSIILALGIIICAIAALLATNKYLRIDYDEMFK